MPRRASTTTEAPATVTPVHPVTDAMGCGRYDCGHVGRSESVPLKRAAFLYLADKAGLGDLRGRHEDAAVNAALALMQAGEACSAIVLAVTGEALAEDEAPRRPKVTKGFTPQQVKILGYVSWGMSIPDIASAMELSPETVKSHLGYIKRTHGVHSTLDAAVIASAQGLL